MSLFKKHTFIFIVRQLMSVMVNSWMMLIQYDKTNVLVLILQFFSLLIDYTCLLEPEGHFA